jgi:hypothetical protein
MPLNPLAFDSQESFEKALLEEGLEKGWTPIAFSHGEEMPDVLEDILEHHGIKGQKWGVRRANRKSSNVTVIDKKKRIKTVGGKGRPAHSDAIVARTHGQVARKSGLKALSNAELRAYNERLNLEQNAKRLTYADSGRGRKFVLKMLGRKDVQQVGKQAGMGIAMQSSKARRAMAKGAAAMAIAGV